MNKLIFEKINFVNLKHEEFNKIIKKNGLFVFPSSSSISEYQKGDKLLQFTQGR